MRQAYPELKYLDKQSGQEVCALYDPVILPSRNRYFDDFAFCYRWRKIGGTINVMPDIHLKHEGSHTFEGSWMESTVMKEVLNK